MPFNFRAFKCSQIIQKACYNLTLPFTQKRKISPRPITNTYYFISDNEIMIVTQSVMHIISILEKKEEFIMFQLQVVRYNFKQNAKSKVQC